MTREEAINVMSQMIKDEEGFLSDNTVEAHKMAIKSLEQERSRSAEITQYRYDCEKLMEENERLKKALEQEPCGDVTTFKEDVLDAIGRIGLQKSGSKEVQAVAECLRAVEALPPVNPQESFKPMVEIDLYSVIKQKYIEREVLDKIRTELEALEQEPCEDAISRQVVLDIVDNYSKSHSNVEDTTQDIISDIMALPPVNPQPKTGYWILTSDDDYEYCICSECGYQNGENWMIGSQIKFCQECGAKMIEPQESEE